MKKCFYRYLSCLVVMLTYISISWSAPAADPCLNKKGNELAACLKANPPKKPAASQNTGTPQNAPAEAAAKAKMQQAVNKQSESDKTKSKQLHDLIKNVK